MLNDWSQWLQAAIFAAIMTEAESQDIMELLDLQRIETGRLEAATAQ